MTLWSTVAYADEFHIIPEPALSSDQFSILSQYKQFSEGQVEGAGPHLKITYSSSIALNAYVAILYDDDTYNPADLYHFTVPATKDGTVIIDLSALTTWTPFHHRYYLSFLSNEELTDTQFTDMVILPGHISDLIRAVFTHILKEEPFWVSSMHLLRGYKILNVSFTLILGVALCIAATVLLLHKRSCSIPSVLILLLIGYLAYDIRMSVDLAVRTALHLKEWTSLHTYGEARDIYSVADALKKDAAMRPTPSAASICFDSTDYYAKLIRYLAYPIPVTLTGSQLPVTTHVIATHSLTWTDSGGILRCGGINHPAKRVREFDDGSVLFSLTP